MTQDLKMDDVSEAEEIRRMLRESARDFAQSKLGRGRQRTLREQPPEARQDAWHDMAELGWTALLVDPLHGGSGLGLREMAIVLEELGRVAAYEPLGPCAVLAAKVIALSDQSA